MPKFIRKPVVVEAEQWINKDSPPDGVVRFIDMTGYGIDMANCRIGDWIITDSNGEKSI